MRCCSVFCVADQSEVSKNVSVLIGLRLNVCLWVSEWHWWHGWPPCRVLQTCYNTIHCSPPHYQGKIGPSFCFSESTKIIWTIMDISMWASPSPNSLNQTVFPVSRLKLLPACPLYLRLIPDNWLQLKALSDPSQESNYLVIAWSQLKHYQGNKARSH